MKTDSCFNRIQLFALGLLLTTLMACGPEKQKQAPRNSVESGKVSEAPETSSPSANTTAEPKTRVPYQEPENLFLKNKVKAKREYLAIFRGQVPDKPHHLSREYSYNQAGKLTQKKTLREDGSIYNEWTYTYNKAGDLIRERNMEGEKEIFLKKHKLDSEGRIIQTVEWYEGDSSMTYWFEYNEKGQLARQNQRAASSGPLNEAKLEYSPDGYLLSRTEHLTRNSKGPELSYEESFTYDNRGLQTEMKQHMYSPDMILEERYTYNDKGWKIRRDGSTKLGTMTTGQRVELQYYDNGLLKTEVLTRSDKNIRSIKEYKYEYWK